MSDARHLHLSASSLLPSGLHNWSALTNGAGGHLLDGALWLVAFCRKQARIPRPSGDVDCYYHTGLTSRIVLGGGSGLVLSASVGGILLLGAIAAIIGALVGTFAGYNIRHSLVARVHLPDFAVALAEDLIAIAGGFLAVYYV